MKISLPIIKLLIMAIALSCRIQTKVESLRFNFPLFNETNESDLIKHGSYVVLNAIQVTPDVRGGPLTNHSGRALYKKRFRLWTKDKNATFDTTFLINVSNQTDPGGEGLAFVLTADTPPPADSHGQWLGLVNGSTNGSASSKIVAVELDTRKSFPEDLDSNHVGLNVNSISSVVQESLTGHGIRISAGSSLAVHIRYDGKNLSVYVSTDKKADPLQDPRNLVFSHAIDLSAYLPEKVYVGFSASTGNETELNCVQSWRFEGLDIGGDSKLLWLWITIPIASVVLAGMLFGSVRYLRSRSKEGEENPSDIEAEIDHCAINPRKFKLRELKKATNHFSPQNKLGQGGFGMVFKGSWKNRDIAVKRVSEKSHQGKQEFISEIKTIGNLNHKNLVKLLGWCYEKKEFLLVYEFMPKGSLDRYLFLEDRTTKRGSSTLGWESRMNIVRGLSHALEYLHNGCDNRILHRDIKASNVMLDSDFNPKLGDFGLARAIQQSEMTHHSTKEIAGTPGYMAPETFLNGRATVETDVYAFGVLMLEVVSGKKPTHFSKEQNYNNSIVNWLWELYRKGTIFESADPRLEGDFEEEEMKSVLLLGLACCHPDPNKRPSMRTVLKVLTGEMHPPDVPKERPAFVWPTMPPSFSDLDYSLTGSQINSLTEITGR
ncbi:PREDICTED: probable L-type lectin-domain containing receptor kinase S.5 [Tarenaya hassleriana]|uniref:probable L-type lectin-domain containing receptor kinase S.5 n=1 Tax=Tarenaya hassleriana TaxID=28532 RepID=UPI00053C0E8E|nr:PREDICTED: probable L-type lectin-domain containing receptor kinase S.5 [Tarenaya hassleriana]